MRRTFAKTGIWIALALLVTEGHSSALAVVAPARRETIRLPDGSSVSARRLADENVTFWVDEYGFVLRRTADGSWDYVLRHGRRVTSLEYGRELARPSNARLGKNAGRFLRPITGATALLALRIAFTDLPGSVPISEHQAILFGRSASVSSYFAEASNGALAVSGTILPADGSWFFLSAPMRAYGSDVGPRNADPNVHDRGAHSPAELVRDAVVTADPAVDFSQYDWDGDGAVDHLLLIHAGEDQATSGRPDDLWSRQVVLAEPLFADGVRVESAMIVAESSPLGTFCHEFAHDLGAPDLYGEKDLGAYCLMSQGCWNGDPPGTDPAMLSAYLRWDIDGDPSDGMRGWIQPGKAKIAVPVAVATRPVLFESDTLRILFEYREQGGFLIYRVGNQDWKPLRGEPFQAGESVALDGTDLVCTVLECGNDDGLLELTKEAAVASAAEREARPELVAYPNPFNQTTLIRLPETLENGGAIEIFNVVGSRVRTLVIPAGARSVSWDGRNEAGRDLPSGSYFILLRTRTGVITARVTLVR